MGPALGGAILLALGPALGIIVNALIYLPLVYWLWRAPYGPRFRGEKATPSQAPRVAAMGFGEIAATLRAVSGDRVILSMTLLAGGASLLVGNAYQAQMPEFAHDLGGGAADMSYSLLLAADAAGALIAGLVLESRGLLQARAKTAFVLAILWCCAIGGFAAATSYALAWALLFVVGFPAARVQRDGANAGANATRPPHIRGRVIGLYTTASLGLRAFAGVSVGLMGSVFGVHRSLAASALVLLVVTVGLLAYTRAPAAKLQLNQATAPARENRMHDGLPLWPPAGAHLVEQPYILFFLVQKQEAPHVLPAAGLVGGHLHH